LPRLLFRLVSAAYERRSLAVGSHWPFDQWAGSCPSTPPRSACSTGRLLHHCHVVITHGESYRMREAKTRGGRNPSTS